LDAERQVGAKMKMEMSTADQSFVDDDRTGLFQAYGGNGGGLGLRQVIPETESEMETDTDFKSTLRASAENLAMNSRRSSAAVGWTDYRLNRRKSAMNLSLLGSKRVVLRNQETTRLFVPRKSSFANVESDRIWNSYFTATKNEIEKIFEQSEKIEWMEHTAESVLNEGYNASQEPIMVRDLSQLY
jgi:hypothetical protein